jgi:hypothetical protein
MTYPGLTYTIGPPPGTAVGQQVRQSRAGEYPGYYSCKGGRWTTVLDTMDGHAPSRGVTALALTVAQELTAFPFPIAGQNFEEDFGDIESGGLDVDTPADVSGQPIEGGLAQTTFPYDFPIQFTEGLSDFTLEFPFWFSAQYEE